MSTVTPKGLAGLCGEALTVEALRQEGFEVDWDGGFTPGLDLRVSRRDMWWLVQVKTTSNSTGKVAYRRDGRAAIELDDRARGEGGAGAFFVLVQLHSAGTHAFDLQARTLTIEMPRDAVLVGLTARQFAKDVDHARTAYGRMRRVRPGRNGEPIGELHHENGLQYPLVTGDYPYLSDFLASLEASTAS